MDRYIWSKILAIIAIFLFGYMIIKPDYFLKLRLKNLSKRGLEINPEEESRQKGIIRCLASLFLLISILGLVILLTTTPLINLLD